jgi:putative protease
LPSLVQSLSVHRTSAETWETNPKIHVLCRSLKQLKALIECGIDSIYADFQDIREYGEAVAIARAEGVQFFLAPPRIQKPGEMGIFHAIAKHQPDGVLVRNLAGVEFFRQRQIPFVADFSFNVTNELTADWLYQYGPLRMTASYDMNRDQLLGLVNAVEPSLLEIVVHQHMPMFHMEHCVFCAVLSPGTDKTNCGRPCDVHQVKLRDRIGMEHPLKADVACRNTLFNAVPQSAAEAVPSLLERGIRHFRIELLDGLEEDDSPRQIISLYRDLLAGRISGQEVWRKLKASNRVGVTRGTLEERRNPLAII